MKHIGRVFRYFSLAAMALMLVACGSSPGNATPARSRTTESASSSKAYLQEDGTGKKRTRSFRAVSGWTLAFSYNCTTMGHKERFTLLLITAGGKAKKVTSQEGLGGGGSRQYSPGRYSLSVMTPCRWEVEAKPGPS